MYQPRFFATDDADWGQAIEIIDDATNLPLDATDTATFNLEVSDDGSAILTATTADASITKPATGTVQWVFPRTSMSGLDTGKTYTVGLTMTGLDGSVTQILMGTLTLVDGGF
jgi:hypothetical protein